MSSRIDNARRATRLLRWYPRSWRELYGEEFVDHLEQEFEERPADFRRTLNVAYNGLIARTGDIGLARNDSSPRRQTRAAVGTSFALSALAAVFVLSFWGRAMIQWNSSPTTRASIPNSVATGVLTVLTGLLLVVLIAIVLTVAGLVVRQALRGRARSLLVPSVFAVGSGAVLLYAVNFFSVFLTELGGIRWSRPGLAIKALGEMGFSSTDGWVDFRNGWIYGSGTWRSVANVLAPLAVLVFGAAIASLVRRVEMPSFAERLGSAAVTLMGTLTGAFLITYLAWITVGGPYTVRYFAWPLSPFSGWIDLAVLVLFTAFVGCSGLRLAQHRDSSTGMAARSGPQ
jgi:hypothetical protein